MYIVKKLSDLSWMVESSDDTRDKLEEYFVNFNFFYSKFVCPCTWNVMMNTECIHIKLVKQFIKDGKSEFE